MAIDRVSSSGVFSILRQIQIQSALMTQAAERLASGFRVNRAADDPSGIVRIASFQRQISGVNAAASNVQTGVSMVQTAEGGLTQIQNLVDEIKTLTIEAQNGALSDTEQKAIQAQVAQLFDSRAAAGMNGTALVSGGGAVQGILDSTKFNGDLLLEQTNAAANTKTFQTGPDANQTTTITLPDIQETATGGGVIGTIAVAGNFANKIKDFLDADATDNAAFTAAASALESSATTASGSLGIQIANMGAAESGLSARLNTLNTISLATNSALSNIRDADVAAESVALASAQLRQQTGLAMLAQFNLQAQTVMTLLRPS